MFRATEIDVTFYVNGARAPLSVTAVRGREGISELFRFEIDLHGEDFSFDFDACIGESGLLVVRWGDVERHVHGIVGSFEQLHTSSEDAS